MMNRPTPHHLQIRAFPLFMTALLLGLLEACTVFFVEYVRLPSSWSDTTLALALLAGGIGGLLFLTLVRFALKRRSIQPSHKIQMDSFSLTAPLWMITLFLVISFRIQDWVLPLIKDRMIVLLMVALITSCSVGLVSILYSAIPLKRYTRFLLLQIRTASEEMLIIRRWSLGILLVATFVFEFLFLLCFEYLLPVFSDILPQYLSIPLAAGLSGFFSGIVVARGANQALRNTQKGITIEVVSKGA